MHWGRILGSLGGLGASLGSAALLKGGGFGPMMGGLGGILGHHGGQPGQMPQMPQQAMPGAMGDVSSPMQPMQTGAPTAPTFPTGMFGAGADPRQEMLKKYQQWQMLNGGGY